MALNSGKHTYQILTNDDEVCIASLYSILLAVMKPQKIKTQDYAFLSVKSLSFLSKCISKRAKNQKYSTILLCMVENRPLTSTLGKKILKGAPENFENPNFC